MADGDVAEGPVQDVSFTDPDAYVRAHKIRDSEYVRLANLPFEARLIHFDLGAFRIRFARFSPPIGEADPPRISAIVRASCTSDRGTLCVPVGGMTGATLNGHELEAGDVLLLAPGASYHHVVGQRHQDWASLDFPAAEFEALLDAWDLPPLRRGADRIFGLAPGQDATALSAALAAAGALAGALPGAVAMPGCVPSIRDGLRDLLLHVFLAQGGHDASAPRRTRGLLLLVDAADEYLREHIARPIYTEELCAVLAVPPRMLHEAFASTYGVSPHTYLKCRRLALVRRALQGGHRPKRLVKSAALAHGFWHMGHFAQDYSAMFGEMPSWTLEGQAGRPVP
jgi:AraC family transcriptional regulator, ethanolamine operon transcriptional activator